MEAQPITCPVPVHGTACGQEELMEKRKPLGVRPGSPDPVTHHECGLHKFHTQPNTPWWLCDCMREGTQE